MLRIHRLAITELSCSIFFNEGVYSNVYYFLCFQLPVISVVLMEANKLRDFFLGTCPPLDDPAADPANLAALF